MQQEQQTEFRLGTCQWDQCGLPFNAIQGNIVETMDGPMHEVCGDAFRELRRIHRPEQDGPGLIGVYASQAEQRRRAFETEQKRKWEEIKS